MRVVQYGLTIVMKKVKGRMLRNDSLTPSHILYNEQLTHTPKLREKE